MMGSTEAVDGTVLTYRICETVADLSGTSQTDLPPLYHSIDPDALEAFLSRPAGGPAPEDHTVQFVYHGYRVTVDAAGGVDVEPRAEPDLLAD